MYKLWPRQFRMDARTTHTHTPNRSCKTMSRSQQAGLTKMVERLEVYTYTSHFFYPTDGQYGLKYCSKCLYLKINQSINQSVNQPIHFISSLCLSKTIFLVFFYISQYGASHLKNTTRPAQLNPTQHLYG